MLAVLGVSDVPALLAFGLSAFVAWATVGELARNIRSFKTANALRPVAGIVGAMRRNRRLHGGLIVHLGLVFAVVAITASTSFKEQTEVSLLQGQITRFAGTTLRYDGTTPKPEPQRMVLVTHLTVLDHGRPAGELIPSLNFYPSSNEPIGTPSIRRGTPRNLFRDLYASVQSISPGGRRATFRLYLNPGVLWLWVGGAVMVLGGLLALWPTRKRRLAPGAVEEPVRELVEAGR
jgi:cytochrome c-type biogenesis protein CcmF